VSEGGARRGGRACFFEKNSQWEALKRARRRGHPLDPHLSQKLWIEKWAVQPWAGIGFGVDAGKPGALGGDGVHCSLLAPLSSPLARSVFFSSHRHSLASMMCSSRGWLYEDARRLRPCTM